MKERRRHPRFPLNGALEVRRFGDATWTSARPFDVSESGLAFTSVFRLAVGEALHIGFAHAAAGELVVDAQVRHVHVRADGGYLVGVERLPM